MTDKLVLNFIIMWAFQPFFPMGLNFIIFFLDFVPIDVLI